MALATNRAGRGLLSLGLLLMLAIAPRSPAADLTSAEDRKIQYLIETVATLPNAEFIRNGTGYDAQSAADHLRLKLKLAGSRVVTAEDFIRLCASVSSVSGLPYRIKFADGTSVSSAVFLRQKLAEFERAQTR